MYKAAPLMLELVSFQTAHIFFAESAPRLIQSISCDIHELSVCLSVHVWRHRFPVDWRLLVNKHSRKFGLPLKFWFCIFFPSFFIMFLFVFWSLPTILLCIVGELAGGGSVAVAFGINDR